MAKAKTIRNNIDDALGIYRNASRMASAAGNKEVLVHELRKMIEDEGIAIIKRNGEVMNDAGLRLALNKRLGALGRAAIKDGVVKDDAAWSDWKSDRFSRLRAVTTIPDVGGILEGLD